MSSFRSRATASFRAARFSPPAIPDPPSSSLERCSIFRCRKARRSMLDASGPLNEEAPPIRVRDAAPLAVVGLLDRLGEVPPRLAERSLHAIGEVSPRRQA